MVIVNVSVARENKKKEGIPHSGLLPERLVQCGMYSLILPQDGRMDTNPLHRRIPHLPWGSFINSRILINVKLSNKERRRIEGRKGRMEEERRKGKRLWGREGRRQKEELKPGVSGLLTLQYDAAFIAILGPFPIRCFTNVVQ